MDYSNIDLKWQNMLAGIEAQAAYVRQAPFTVYQQVKERLALPGLPARVYLVGCGDSWYCGLATRLAFEAWAGVPTESLQALEFSRYYSAFAPQNSLVVAISNSGRIARTVEAVLQARANGQYTVAGTSALDSRIAQAAEVTLDLGYAERRFAPGTSSYVASLMVLYCVALRLAELAGALTAAGVQAKLEAIAAEADGMQRTVEANKPVMESLGERARLSDKAIFIGGGPNYGTAFFSRAKVIEAARAYASGQELEEWAHEQYFVTDKDTYTFVIAPPGASLDRAREQLWAANEMGSTTVAVCAASDLETGGQAKVHAPVFSGGDEILSPLSYCIPGELFAFFLAVSKNVKMLGFDDPHIKEVNWRQIFDSQTVVRRPLPSEATAD